MPESCPKSYVMGCVYLFLFNFRFRISDSNPLDSEIRAASCEFEYRSDGLSLRDCDSAGETSYQRILGHCDAGVAARLCFSSPLLIQSLLLLLVVLLLVLAAPSSLPPRIREINETNCIRKWESTESETEREWA